MSPAGYSDCLPKIWDKTFSTNCNNGSLVIPVINLKSNVLATGTGTEDEPYVIKTN